MKSEKKGGSAFLVTHMVKNLPTMEVDPSSTPGSRTVPGEGNG